MNIVLPASTALVVFIYDKFFSKKKMTPLDYVILIISLFLASASFSLFSNEYPFYPEENDERVIPSPECVLNDQQKKYFTQKKIDHEQTGYSCLQIAKNKSWYIPCIKDRDIAMGSITALVASLQLKDPKAILVITTYVALENYLSGVYDEWKEIDTYMNMAKYHFEMADFYYDVLQKG